MNSQKDIIIASIEMSLKIIRMYDWLLDLYVLDFFVDNHWQKLPPLWREFLNIIDPQDLGNILSGHPTKYVAPLSLLALVNSVKSISLPRTQCYSKNHLPNTSADLISDTDKCGSHPRLRNLFIKHVKLKKRHEIDLMADLVHRVAEKTKCDKIVDFGSGLGHLVRVLAYKHDLHTVGIECQPQLTEEARKLDLELEYTAKKHLSKEAISNLKRPSHLNITLSSESQLLQLLPDNVCYGLVGLHPCGDLGPLLLKHFVSCDRVKFICVVGCCFMKLTCNCEPCGYPMSKHVKSMDSALSYVSREIACHAIEVYCERLRKGDYEDLKVHAYRAALERILMDHNLKHAPIRSIKHTNTMTFESYCEAALRRLPARVSRVSRAAAARGARDVARWRRVVALYSLRLALAPLVETVVLLDRMLYVVEHGFACEIHPVFDPKLSPRNHIIIGTRM